MRTQNIDGNAHLESSAPTICNGSRPFGHRTIHNVPTFDNASIFSHSTTSTASNLPGTGRVLDNLFSFAGKQLESSLGNMAHKAGFGPEAIYKKICTLHLEDWRSDNEKGEGILTIQIARPLTASAPAVSY